MPRVPRREGVAAINVGAGRDTLPVQGAITRATQPVLNFFERREQERAKSELSTGTASFTAGVSDLIQSLNDAEDPTQIVAQYDEQAGKMAEAALEPVKNPTARAELGERLQRLTQRFRLQAFQMQNQKEGEARIAALEISLDAYEKTLATLDPSDPLYEEILFQSRLAIRGTEDLTLAQREKRESDFIDGLEKLQSDADVEEATRLINDGQFAAAQAFIDDRESSDALSEQQRRSLTRQRIISEDQAEQDRRAAVGALQDSVSQQFLARIKDRDDPRGPVTIPEILASDLDVKRQEHYIEMLEGQTKTTDPFANDSLTEIRVWEGARAGVIKTQRDVEQFIGPDKDGNPGLSVPKATQIISYLEGKKNEETKRLEDAYDNFFARMKPVILGGNPFFTGIDPVASNKLLAFEQEVRDLRDKRIAEGKNPFDLITVSHSEYLGLGGKSGFIEAFRTSALDAAVGLREALRLNGSTEAIVDETHAPRRKLRSGESLENYARELDLQ